MHLLDAAANMDHFDCIRKIFIHGQVRFRFANMQRSPNPRRFKISDIFVEFFLGPTVVTLCEQDVTATFYDSAKIINEEINCLDYYNKLERKNIINSEFLDFTFCWLSGKMDLFLFNTNIHRFQSLENNCFSRRIIRKKIAYSTGLRDKVFIKDCGLVCSVYGCKMMGSTRRKIMRSLLLKALIG